MAIKSKYAYIFYRVYQYTEEEHEFSYMFSKYYPIVQNVLRINKKDNVRDKIKQKLQELHPEVKYFRRTKNKEDMYFGKFFEVDEKMYIKYNSNYDFECKVCRKEIKEQNVRQEWCKDEGYCSDHCMRLFKDVKLLARRDVLNELDVQIDDEYYTPQNFSHLGTAGFIYKITNKITGKCYVGQSINQPIFRWWTHLKYKDKFDHNNDLTILQFEVLEKVKEVKGQTNYKTLLDREDYWVRQFNAVDNGYNSLYPVDRVRELKEQLKEETAQALQVN